MAQMRSSNKSGTPSEQQVKKMRFCEVKEDVRKAFSKRHSRRQRVFGPVVKLRRCTVVPVPSQSVCAKR